MSGFRLQIVNEDGESVRLDGTGSYRLGIEPSLWGGPPVQLTTQTATVGERRLAARHLPKIVSMPVVVVGRSFDDMWELVTDFCSLIDPVAGQIRVRATRPDGRVLEMLASVEAGHDAVKIPRSKTRRLTVPLTLKAHWPYWRDVQTRDELIDVGVPDGTRVGGQPWNDAGIDWNEPDTPWNGINVPDAGALGIELYVGGDVEVWPLWQMNSVPSSPVTSMRVTSLTSGRSWKWAANPGVENLVVDTDPDSRFPVVADGVNAVDGLTQDFSGFFPLEPERNHIVIEVEGANSQFTRIRANWRDQFLSL